MSLDERNRGTYKINDQIRRGFIDQIIFTKQYPVTLQFRNLHHFLSGKNLSKQNNFVTENEGKMGKTFVEGNRISLRSLMLVVKKCNHLTSFP